MKDLKILLLFHLYTVTLYNSRHAGKKSQQTTFEVFFFLIFPRKTGFDISCKLSPLGDNLHEMSNPVFLEKEEKKFFRIMLFAEIFLPSS